MFDLKGKKALVTGATGGIGSAISKKLAEQGVIVGLSGRSESKLKTLEEGIDGKTFIFECNLSNAESVEKLFKVAEEKMNGVDILISNAGIIKNKLITEMSNEDWDIVMNVNLRASFILNREAVKKMLKRKWGRIINITSLMGVIGNYTQANYAASKAGLIGMSKSIAKEVGSKGITVNCIAPGFIKTPMTDSLTEEQKKQGLKSIPIGKIGTPEDIANSVVYLASNEAKYITGQTFHVNGGMAMI